MVVHVKAGDDAEVLAAASKSPIKVRVRNLVDVGDRAIGKNELGDSVSVSIRKFREKCPGSGASAWLSAVYRTLETSTRLIVVDIVCTPSMATRNEGDPS
jgi:hypothetical protein